jgi:hypothetical protein
MSNIAISISKLDTLKMHTSFRASRTQEEYYRENDSPESILQYVRLPGKTFGEKWCESICKEYFNMDRRSDSSHDHTKLGKTIEQKSARYGGNGAGWKWQHIEMCHNWDYLLLTGLEFNGFRFYIAGREKIEELIREGVITGQGKKDENGIAQPQQAYWFEKSNFKKKGKNFDDYFTELIDEQSLIDYIN